MRALLTAIVLCMALVIAGCGSDPAGDAVSEDALDYASLGLETDASVSSIDQSLILSGGPSKDGIPALTQPGFVSIEESDLGGASRGLLVDLEGERRYYPYSILVWHEVVNDRIGDTPIAVTF